MKKVNITFKISILYLQAINNLINGLQKKFSTNIQFVWMYNFKLFKNKLVHKAFHKDLS